MNVNHELVNVKNLTIGFTVEELHFEAVDSISFSISESESVGLVGESGCGKTITSMALIRLLPSPPALIKGGNIFFHGKNILTMLPEDLKKIRGREIGVIFQEPMTSLNPVKKIGIQVSEPLRIHFPGLRKKEIYEKTILMLKEVGLSYPERVYSAYPHMLSGGMRQRAGIATAMICKPRLLIADEPTTALDVTIQAQIMDLIKNLKQEHNMSLLLITHNLGLVAEMCKRVIVMYAGRFAEIASSKSLFHSPLHPYTEGLMTSIPLLTDEGCLLTSIPGSVPHPADYLKGCRFMPRCIRKIKRCMRKIPPPLFLIDTDHYVSCWLYEKQAKGSL
ncbi:MAG: ABC transporter ATP-binding protein [Spirochaetales bacterium]|nr:ABC transporter ATP-binding protein [Spirochaetales bacterium]